MKSIWSKIAPWVGAGEPFALATLLSVDGSGPRAPGATLAIKPTPEGPVFHGGVSSGCIESDLVERTPHVLSRGAVEVLTFAEDGPTPWAPGLPCGGAVTVRLEPYFAFHPDPVMREIAAIWQRFLVEDEPGALLSRDDRHLLMMSDGSVLGHRREWTGEALEWALQGIRDERAGGQLRADDSGATFVRFNQPSPRLVLVGAVEIAVALVELVQHRSVRPLVVDPRTAYVRRERFGSLVVELRPAWPQDTLPGLSLGPRDAVVVLAHDEKIDDPALISALATNCGYIGALGSRRSHEARLERLRAGGLADAPLARLRAPVGLWRSGRDPREIALSILAEWVSLTRLPRTHD